MNYHIKTWLSGRLEAPNSKGSGKTGLANYTTFNLALKSEKMPTSVIDNMRSN